MSSIPPPSNGSPGSSSSSSSKTNIPQEEKPEDLKLVTNPLGKHSAEQPVGSGASRKSGMPIWVFLLLIVAFVVVLGWQLRVADGLEEEIAGLEQDLRETRTLLGAHESRLLEVRSGVHDLSARLEGLKALVDLDPSNAVSAGTTTNPVDPVASDRSIPARLPHQ